MQATAIGDMSIEPLLLWRSNSKRFATIASLVRVTFAIQSSYVANEFVLSCFLCLVSPSRSVSWDETISPVILLCTWNKLF